MFLPQYAANAVIDLESFARKYRGHPALALYAFATDCAAKMIRTAVHVVLPTNGEIYRSNDLDRTAPSTDEADSFVGLPAPVTCFEYAWTHFHGGGGNQCLAARRITLVSDSKQVFKLDSQPPPGMVHTAAVISVFFNEHSRTWVLSPFAMNVAQPLASQTLGTSWGVRACLRDFTTDKTFESNTEHSREVAGELFPDLIAAVQCCHALRAGASFEEHTEQHASRRWKFDKRGVGDFTYHVLKLPATRSATGHADISGSHDSPRYHIRRAHIRKLPSGVLTFVRHCFVGDPAKGAVGKHYGMQKHATPPG
jgi:hypothetical protein